MRAVRGACLTVMCVAFAGVVAPSSVSAQDTLSPTRVDRSSARSEVLPQSATVNASRALRSLNKSSHPHYAWMMLADRTNKPIRWNACAPITWSWAGGNATDKKLMRQGLKEWARAGRFTFKEVRSKGAVRVAYRHRPGNQGSLGFGGPSSFWGPEVYSAGTIDINSSLRGTKRYKRSGRDRLVRYELFMHEWGHVLGLDHVKPRSEVMYPVADGFPRHLGSGDKRGAALLGRAAGCQNSPTMPTNVVGRVITETQTWDGEVYHWYWLRLSWKQNVPLYGAYASVRGVEPSASDELLGTDSAPYMDLEKDTATCTPGRVKMKLNGDYGDWSGYVNFTCAN